MGSVPLNNDATETKRLGEVINHVYEIRDGVVGEGQGLSEEDESRVNEVAEDINGHEGAIQTPAVVQQPPQQPQGPVVSWERFLPLRSLKVLLVENDDSTRHVVSALLRNCSYEVTTASNGLQAWKILQDLTNHIDLVLSEVVMPYFSGIGLLCKIMNHKTCKNIPVIMMSSHDSMGIVFKCLSKGAVDFLVKPIRKNELKNLWQHVWRRCHSSSDSGSGSGSESRIQTRKSTKSKSVEESVDNTGSNDEDDSPSIGLNVRDGSDNGSGTQSTWAKQAVEVDSPQPMSLWNQIADPPGSTCAQIIHPKTEAFDNEGPVTTKRDCEEQDEQLDSVAMGKDLEIGVPRNSDLLLKYPSEKISANFASTKQDISPVLDCKDCEKIFKGAPELKSKNPIGKMRPQDAELMATVADSTNNQLETVVSEVPYGFSMIPDDRDKTVTDSEELPSLELSLKWLKGVGDVGTATHDECNVLRHSDVSAFSRYNNASTANQAANGNLGSCSLGNNSEAPKTQSIQNFHSNGTLPNHQSHGCSNNNDMGSTTKNAFTKPALFNDKFGSTSTAKSLHPAAFQPVQNGHVYPPQQVIPKKANDGAAAIVQAQPKDSKQDIQIQHHHYHYHHYHHHLHNLQPQQPPDHEDSLFKNMAAAGPQCGSSNVSDGPVEGNTGNCSLNGSASGSNHGSNWQNGGGTAMNLGRIKIESDYAIAEKSGAGSGSGSRIGVDENRRVAVLTKFRQKRKERCFEKKLQKYLLLYALQHEDSSEYSLPCWESNQYPKTSQTVKSTLSKEIFACSKETVVIFKGKASKMSSCHSQAHWWLGNS
ncbi:two-component response regulator-like PRR73 isoform X2 [Macadamia integrifolia]|uniref:two-component response regulator-like PRR73 isoform X2 n=1 Tax=Macadamia integrifolia TaxID=60698 RepID=UPI001C52F8FF|nr:two-component response regulator-like PRR73 isoform X2 [Macadamia integrifolia]